VFIKIISLQFNCFLIIALIIFHFFEKQQGNNYNFFARNNLYNKIMRKQTQPFFILQLKLYQKLTQIRYKLYKLINSMYTSQFMGTETTRAD